MGNSDRRVVRIEKTIQAYNGNFLDKVTDDCEKNMEYALQRVDERTAVVSDDESK